MLRLMWQGVVVAVIVDGLRRYLMLLGLIQRWVGWVTKELLDALERHVDQLVLLTDLLSSL